MPQPPEDRPYTTYRSAPRGLVSRLRGETDAELEARADQLRRQSPAGRVASGAGGRGGGAGGPGGPDERWDRDYEPRRRRLPLPFRRRRLGLPVRPWFHPLRLLKYVVLFCVFWVALSVVLFFISAAGDSGNLPGGSATEAALSGAGPMLFTPNNILILGLDNRPTSGYSSKEGGLTASDHSEADANTDSIMIWRLGGGVSRKLSIARDTLVDIPNCGEQKINAAWSCDGPKGTIQVVEQLTGLKINHLVVVDLGNFTKFINDIGGVSVKIPTKICSNISGGAKNGGYSLYLNPGEVHLNGDQALTLARTRENSCDPAWDDFNRQKMQQEIMNGIKGQLFSVHAFVHLPWASWDAPRTVQTDMGPIQLMEMFISSEIGGSSAAETLTETGAYRYIDGGDEDVQLPNAANVQAKVNQLLHG